MEDLLYRFLNTFNALPGPVRQMAGFLYRLFPNRIKHGSFYFTYSRRLRDFSGIQSIQETNSAQQDLLFKQVNGAVESIPFYRKYPKVRTIEDFQAYPVITKDTILDSFPEFINSSLNKSRLKSNTGGSSGTPMEFYLEKNVSRPKEKAHFDWYWRQFGYTRKSRILMIRGKPLPNNRILEINTINNTLNVSCYNVNEENISMVIKQLNRFDPQFIHAYPSALKNITSLLENHRNSLTLAIDGAFLGSEQLSDSDRAYFEEFYTTKVINWYGHSERLIHGGNCPFSNEYHFFPAYGYLELLDDNNQPVTRAGEEGRIVATGFDNRVQPFIRYDTGDLGVLSASGTCKCGFKGTSLQQISGRGQDYILLSDNTRVSLTAFIFGQHLDAFRRIREMQVVQKRAGEIELRIVKNDTFSRADEDALTATLMRSVDNKVQVNLKFEKELPKTHRGKNVFFVSELT